MGRLSGGWVLYLAAPLKTIILLKRGEGYVIDKYYIATVNLADDTLIAP